MDSENTQNALPLTFPKQVHNGFATDGNLLRWYFQVTRTFHYMHVEDVLLSRSLAGSKLPENELQLRNREFWFNVLPQTCLSHPAVSQAAMAYVSLYCSQILEVSENRQFFVSEFQKHRNNALRLISTSNDGSTIWDTLIGCIFFTCFEFASGNLNAGRKHMAAGRKIVEELDKYNAIPPDQVVLIRRYVAPIIDLFTSNMLFTDEMTGALRTVVHNGRTPLDRLEKKWINLAKTAQRLDWIVDPTSCTSPKFDLLSGMKRDLATLSAEVDILEIEVGLNPTTSKLFRYLQSYKRMLVILAYCFPCDDECALDDYENLFSSVIQNMRALFEIMESAPITMCAQRALLKTSIFPKLWLIPPLFFTATRCRNSVVRWDAVRILRLIDRTEGGWNSNLAACIAAEAINIEEQAASDFDDTGNISSEDRIRLHSIHRVRDSIDEVRIFYKRYPYDIITPVQIKQVKFPASVFTSEIHWVRTLGCIVYEIHEANRS